MRASGASTPGARAGKLSDAEIMAFREVLYAGCNEDQVPAEKGRRRQADPVKAARMQLESSRRHKTQALLKDVAKRQRRRPTV